MSQTPDTFEQRMERLQRIVDELEKGDLPLEKSVALFREGQTLSAALRESLEQARREVTVCDESGIVPFPDLDSQENHE